MHFRQHNDPVEKLANILINFSVPRKLLRLKWSFLPPEDYLKCGVGHFDPHHIRSIYKGFVSKRYPLVSKKAYHFKSAEEVSG